MGQTRTLCMWSSPSLSLFFSFSSRAYFSTSSLDQVMPLRVPEVNMDIPFFRNITCWLELELSAPTTLDISSMLFESTTERVFYVVTLASSFFSVCMSFTKLAKVLYWPSIINYQLLLPHSVLYWPSSQLYLLDLVKYCLHNFETAHPKYLLVSIVILLRFLCQPFFSEFIAKTYLSRSFALPAFSRTRKICFSTQLCLSKLLEIWQKEFVLLFRLRKNMKRAFDQRNQWWKCTACWGCKRLTTGNDNEGKLDKRFRVDLAKHVCVWWNQWSGQNV